MQAVIAGATGLIGQQLVAYWLAKEYQITVIGRQKEKIQRIFNGRVKVLTWDELTSDCFRHVDVVVNLAGENIAEKTWNEKRKKEILQSRLESTQKIVQALLPLGKDSPALFNASAVGVYGLQRQAAHALPEKLDEQITINLDQAPDFLAKIAREWEKATQPLIAQGVRVVNLRFGVVLAKRGGALPRILRPFKFFVGGKVGTGQQPFSWVALDDAVRAINFILHNRELIGPINVVAPDGVTQKRLASVIGKILRRPTIVTVPAWLLKMIFGEMAQALLLEGQHVYPQKLLAAGFDFKYGHLEHALRHELK